MKFFYRHWFDIGAIIALIIIIWLAVDATNLSSYQLLMWISLVTLCLHQLEEYRVVGTFPGMVNHVMYHSTMPDRYPLNMKTSFIVNVVIGWGFYLLAAVLGERAVWLGIATILISVGNTVAHTTMFNIKGKSFYNAGMATSLIFFAPLSVYFFWLVTHYHIAHLSDYLVGIPLGILLNVIGILKLIDWMKDKNSPYIFSERFLLKADRMKHS